MDEAEGRDERDDTAGTDMVMIVRVREVQFIIGGKRTCVERRSAIAEFSKFQLRDSTYGAAEMVHFEAKIVRTQEGCGSCFIKSSVDPNMRHASSCSVCNS